MTNPYTTFDNSSPLEPAYYIVAAINRAESPRIKAFRDWVLSEAEDEREARARA